MITELSKAEYQDEMAALRLRRWKQLPRDETGAPISDKRLLSPIRLLLAVMRWYYLKHRGVKLGFWYMLRWDGRRYAQFKNMKAGKRYGKPTKTTRNRTGKQGC